MVNGDHFELSFLLPILKIGHAEGKPVSRIMKESNLPKDVEAVIRRCPVKKLFPNISQNPQGNACTEIFFS